VLPCGIQICPWAAGREAQVEAERQLDGIHGTLSFTGQEGTTV
jgi:hypothetical protein